jgi:hypothetical protein
VNTSEILNKAADLIETHGWGTGTETWRNEGSGLCLEGGIAAAAGCDPLSRTSFKECAAYGAMWDFLKDDGRWGAFREDLYDWNDATDRTASEVIEVLRAAAVIEAAKEAEPAKVSA